MKRILGLVTVLTAAAMVIPTVASARITTTRFTAITISQQLVDNPPIQTAATQPPSTGDVLIFRDRLLSRGRTVGFDRISCTVTDFPHALCTGSTTLARGHITAVDQFNLVSHAAQPFAIIGGTGIYRSARGDATIRMVTPALAIETVTVIT
jgi:allene oxide cyclase-like protein